MCYEVPRCVTRYPLGYRLLLFCKYLSTCALQLKLPGGCCIGATLQQHHVMLCEIMLWLCDGYVMATGVPQSVGSQRVRQEWVPKHSTWPLRQPERGCLMAAMPARREQTRLPSLQLLTSSSSLLTPALPTLSSANSMKSKTVGITNRINSVIPITEKKLNCYLQIRQIFLYISCVCLYE